MTGVKAKSILSKTLPCVSSSLYALLINIFICIALVGQGLFPCLEKLELQLDITGVRIYGVMNVSSNANPSLVVSVYLSSSIILFSARLCFPMRIRPGFLTFSLGAIELYRAFGNSHW